MYIILMQGCPMGGGPNRHPLLKYELKAGEVAQLVEGLFSMCKVLGFGPQYYINLVW